MSSLVYPALPGISVDVQRESFYNTRRWENPGGTEQRVSFYSAARYRFRITYPWLRQGVAAPSPFQAYSELGAVLYFLDTHRGSWDSFLFNDPVDSTQRRVRFDEDSLRVTRISDTVYSAAFDLVTVAA